jgi:mannose-6-phosphate isomerase-like protein (cupin superfamily)
MNLSSVNLAQAFDRIDEYWSPRVGGDINQFQIKLAKFQGEFHWHQHDHEDELFLVMHGELLMKLRPESGGDKVIKTGEYIIVPKGTQHCPTALTPEVHCILFEPKSTLNTGEVINERTVTDLKRVSQ